MIEIASFIFFVTFFVIRRVLMPFSYDVVTRFRLIRHTKCLLEEKEDSLCIKVLQTLREMMTVDNEYGEKVQIKNSYSRILNINQSLIMCIKTYWVENRFDSGKYVY